MIRFRLLKFKSKFANDTNAGTSNVEKAVLLKYLNIFWRTLKMFFFNCEINFILT